MLYFRALPLHTSGAGLSGVATLVTSGELQQSLHP